MKVTLDNDTVNFAEGSLTTQIATREVVGTMTALQTHLPDPDPILSKRGLNYKCYRELLIDSHLAGCVEQRKSATLRLLWEIDRGKAKSKEAELIDSIFRSLNLNKIFSEILDAVLYGYQLLEIVWEYRDNLIVPVDIIGKPQEWFKFDAQNRVRFKSTACPEGELLPNYKFLLVQNKPSYDNPYGDKVLSRTFWPVTFKKGSIKFWLTFLEKFGTPHVIGKLPRSASSKEVTDLLGLLEGLLQDACAVIPDDSSIEVKEPAGKAASNDMYDKFIAAMEKSISKAVLSQTLTTDVGDTGSYAASQTHNDVLGYVVDSDKKLIETALNQLIRFIIKINFSNQTNYPEFVLFEEGDIDEKLATRDKTLSDQGVKFTKQYYIRNYNLQEDEFDVVEKSEPAAFQFAENDKPINKLSKQQSKIDDLVKSLNYSKLTDKLISEVIELVEKSESKDELTSSLIKLYPGMNFSELEEKLTSALFVADLYGRIKKHE